MMTTALFPRVILPAGLGLLAILTLAGPPRASAAPPERVDVIITFHQTPGPAEQTLVRGAGGDVRGSYRIVPAIAATLPSQAAAALQRNPRVARVEPDVAVFALHLDGTGEVKSAWGVDRLDANLLWGTTQGAGVGVAVVDTGSGPHVDLPDAEGRFNCLSGSVVAGGPDDNGHGSHVAGSILALQNGSGVVGMAPAATLFSYKVLNSSGSGSFSNVIAALDHIVQHNAFGSGTPIRVANFSLGSSGDPGLTVRQAFDNAYASGVLLVAAAGNSGNRKGVGDRVNHPARYASVVAVAATDKLDKRATFSSTGPDVEWSAPGVKITSTYLNNGYASLSGTSMACPHAAGAAALLIAAGGLSDANGINGIADEARSRLTATVKDLGAAGHDTLYGHGLVNPQKAVTGGNTHF